MKTKSIWGNPPKRLYNLVNLIKKDCNHDTKICIVGCSDGKFLLPFAREKIFSVGYDIDEIALYGGTKLFPIKSNFIKYNYDKNFKSQSFPLEEKDVLGICDRLKLENLQEFAEIEKLDFYKNTPKRLFDLVFTSCSLHYSVNSGFTLKEKVEKLQSIVKVGGYIYIDYMMAIEEDDFNFYPKNKFFRKGEMKSYFNDDFEVLHIKENNFISFEGAHVDCVVDHFHRFGYILGRRIR